MSAHHARPQRADGATLLCVFLLMLLIIPARLVVSGIPMSITPATLVGLGLGLVWFCCQMVATLGVAKGRNIARTALFLFAMSQMATYGYGTRNYLPIDELQSADRTIITLFGTIFVGIAACDGVRNLARLDVLLKFMTVGMAVVATVGLLQFAIGFDLTEYLALPGLRPATEDGFVLERSVFRRPAGTTGHPIEFGVVCAIGVPLAAHYAYRTKEAGLKAGRWWLCLALIACGSVISLSRSAILGLVLGGLVLMIGWPGRRRVPALIAAAGFLVVLRMIVPGLIGTLYSLFDSISDDPSISGRTDDYSSAGEQIAKHPLLGRGSGTYLAERYGPLDNQYLGVLVENGYIGLITFIFLFLAGIYAATRARQISEDPVIHDLALSLIACQSIIALGAATFDLLWFSTATGLLFVLIGVSGALLRAVQAQSAGATTPPYSIYYPGSYSDTERCPMTDLARTRPSTPSRVLGWLDIHSRQIAFGAVVVSLLVAGGYAVILGDQLRYLDEGVYLQLTQAMAEGHGYSTGAGTDPTAYRPPGYPFLLLPIHLLTGGSILAMRFVAVLCLAGAVWFGYLLGRRISPAVGALTAVGIACYPLVIYTANAIYPQVPALLLLLAMVEFGLRTQDGGDQDENSHGRWMWAVRSGLAGGLLTITVPSHAPTIPLLLSFLFWRARHSVPKNNPALKNNPASKRIAQRTAALLLVVAAVIPGAWCIRNAIQLKAFIPVSTNNGVNLLLGNNPNATPSSGVNADISVYDQQAKLMRLDEVGIDRFYSDSAVRWITENPVDAATLYAGKVAHNFAHSDTLRTAGQNTSELLAALTYYPILALAVVRVLLIRRFPLHSTEKLTVWLIVVNVVLLAIFFTRVRFRVPLDAFTIMLAMSTVVHLWRARVRRETSP